MLNLPADDARAVAIMSAIRSGDVDGLQRQLRDNPDLATARIIDKRGVARTLLHVAADSPGHFPNGRRIAVALVEAGADVNAGVIHPRAEAPGETPLHWAASNDDVDLLEALLALGADIEVPGAVFTGGTPMSDAVVFAQWRAARILLERGATTTIWQAAALGLLDRVRQFCLNEPLPLSQQITNSFWHACRGGQREVAEYLLERGADLNWIGYDRKTPLDVAEESGAGNLVQWLRNRGAKRARS